MKRLLIPPSILAAPLRFVLLPLTLLTSARAAAPAPTVAPTPERLLAQGRADEAVRQLQGIIAQRPTDPLPLQLLCRVFYAEELPDPAIAACEQAVSRNPGESSSQMWLGHAYGLKAENASPVSAFSLARKVRAAFERAVQLDPANVPAQTALGQFYIAAPVIIGGGLDKAGRVAAQLMPLSPAAAHRLLAMAAEKRNDLSQAETQFRAAVKVSHTPAAWVDLGAFYQRRHQPDQAVAALSSAIAADRDHDAALMDIASILTDAHRAPDLAEKVLRLYLDSPATSEAAPVFKVHVQLGQLLAQRGDTAAARREYTAALALASAYLPARRALDTLR